ncbi:hypothetical protein, partial [Acinetobacter baumannii]
MMQKIQQAGGMSKLPSPSPLDTAPHRTHKKNSLSEKVKAKSSVHDKFHRTLILSGFCLLKIAK